MNTPVTNYGEPWKVVEHSWSDSSIHNAKGKWLISHSIDNEDTTEDNQEERYQEQSNMLGRIVSSVNACAGMDDPEKEIPKLRADISMLNQRIAERTKDMLEKFAVIEADLRKRAADAEKEAFEMREVIMQAHDSINPLIHAAQNGTFCMAAWDQIESAEKSAKETVAKLKPFIISKP